MAFERPTNKKGRFLVSELETLKPKKVADPVNLNDVLENLAADIVDCLKKNIAEHEIKDTGELANSIQMPIKLFGSVLTATLSLEDYYDYVNKGVRGAGGNRKTEGGKYLKTGPHQAWKIRAVGSPYYFSNLRPPLSALKKWCSKRGLNVYAVQESIFRKGLKSRPFYDECIDQSFKGALWDRFKSQIKVTSAKNITRELKSTLTSKQKVRGMGPHQKR
jgi:hypothetical protein|tara:strand:+ start:697 stop:1353 length:657 start_codon:yes stop_codon:yes gene_type:complete